MKLVLNTAYGISILLYKEQNLLWEYQNLSVQSEDVFDVFRQVMDDVCAKFGVHFKQLKHVIFIDGPGSQIGSKVGAVCVKPILLLYPYVQYKIFSYFEVMLMNVADLLKHNGVCKGGDGDFYKFYKQNEILFAIGVSKQRFYCVHVINREQTGKEKSGNGGVEYEKIRQVNMGRGKYERNEGNGVNCDEYQTFVSMTGEEFYFKTYSYSYVEIDEMLNKNSNLFIVGHERFEHKKNYIKGLFPLNLAQIQKVVSYI